MKYFLYANTEKKPVMRFFDHWFEVSDFLTLMDWSLEQIEFPIEVYEKIDGPKKKSELNGIREESYY